MLDLSFIRLVYAVEEAGKWTHGHPTNSDVYASILEACVIMNATERLRNSPVQGDILEALRSPVRAYIDIAYVCVYLYIHRHVQTCTCVYIYT